MDPVSYSILCAAQTNWETLGVYVIILHIRCVDRVKKVWASCIVRLYVLTPQFLRRAAEVVRILTDHKIK